MKDGKNYYEEIKMKAKNGWGMLFLIILFYLLSVGLFALGMGLSYSDDGNLILLGTIMIIAAPILLIVTIFMSFGFRIVKPNEALVLTFFGKYAGSIKEAGFHHVNPFCLAVKPPVYDTSDDKPTLISNFRTAVSTKHSLKTMTLKNEKQKINDLLGTPIDIGVNVIWRIENTARAVFNVDNYAEFTSTQADSALRNIVRLYPYDISEEDDEKSLRGSSQEVADMLKNELQKKVDIAGIEIIDVRITHLAYAPEIAASMLQRQQATAVIEARQKIVEGAVGMVQMALDKLSDNNVCELDEERKAQMVSNLLVVLCGNKDAQPIVNSGTIY